MVTHLGGSLLLGVLLGALGATTLGLGFAVVCNVTRPRMASITSKLITPIQAPFEIFGIMGSPYLHMIRYFNKIVNMDRALYTRDMKWRLQ